MYLALLFIAFTWFMPTASAQTKDFQPELSVAGISIGDRAAAKTFLEKYSARKGEDGRPVYYFYNKFGTQVLKLTADSFEDPYFLTEIEVFAVDKDYLARHYVLDKIGFFVTESGIFIGYRQSAVSFIVGIPNVGREDMIGPKDVIRKKGSPAERTIENKREILSYQQTMPALPFADQDQQDNDLWDYSARFEFHKNKLKKFILKIMPSASAK